MSASLTKVVVERERGRPSIIHMMQGDKVVGVWDDGVWSDDYPFQGFLADSDYPYLFDKEYDGSSWQQDMTLPKNP